MKTVWIYEGKELKVFATEEAAREWLDKNDPEGVAFEHPLEGPIEPTNVVGARKKPATGGWAG